MKLFLALLMTVAAFNASAFVSAPQFFVVTNGAASAFVKGQAVCPKLTATDGVTAAFCSAEGVKPFGIVTDVSCAVGAKCKLQTKGYINFGKFTYLATATAAGGLVYATTTGDIVRPASVTTAMFPIGISYEAVSANSTTLKVYIGL